MASIECEVGSPESIIPYVTKIRMRVGFRCKVTKKNEKEQKKNKNLLPVILKQEVEHSGEVYAVFVDIRHYIIVHNHNLFE